MTLHASAAASVKALFARQSEAEKAAGAPGSNAGPPAYLIDLYWWAYAHPRAVKVFEREWLINAILFGNYKRLRAATITALGPDYHGRSLQVACAYGGFTPELARRVQAAGGALDVIDALPAQIENVRRKLGPSSCARATLMDSAALDFADGAFDRAVLFMLMHEQPAQWRRRTLIEAARVLKTGGRLVLVDYARPDWRHPLRYLLPPVLWALEPFALDLWRQPIDSFYAGLPLRRVAPLATFFGGLYQLIVLEKV